MNGKDGVTRPGRLPSRRAILAHFDRADPVIAQLVRRFGPLQLKRNRNYFLVLCKAIIAQQISTRAAHSITQRFLHLFDSRAPTCERVHALSESALRAIGLSRQKAAYLKDLSRHFLEHSIRPRRLAYMDNQEVIRQLTRVHGIGIWTAEMFLIFSLNRLDVLPVADLGLRTALQNLYGMKKPPSVQRMRALGKKWHPLETVATWYAWRSVDENIIAY